MEVWYSLTGFITMLSGRQLHAHVQVVVVASSCSTIVPLSFASPPARNQSVVMFSSVMGGSYFSLFKVTHKFDSCCAELGNCLAKWPRDFSGTCHTCSFSTSCCFSVLLHCTASALFLLPLVYCHGDVNLISHINTWTTLNRFGESLPPFSVFT